MEPWLPVDFGFDIHAFFNIHAIGQHTVNLYPELLCIISFYQLNHAIQGG